MAAHSPVELAVVIVRLPPEVEPDEQQTEGEEEDEGPQQLPLHRQKKLKNKKNTNIEKKIGVPYSKAECYNPAQLKTHDLNTDQDTIVAVTHKPNPDASIFDGASLVGGLIKLFLIAVNFS